MFDFAASALNFSQLNKEAPRLIETDRAVLR